METLLQTGDRVRLAADKITSTTAATKQALLRIAGLESGTRVGPAIIALGDYGLPEPARDLQMSVAENWVGTDYGNGIPVEVCNERELNWERIPGQVGIACSWVTVEIGCGCPEENVEVSFWVERRFLEFDGRCTR